MATWHGCPATASLESDEVVPMASGASAPARLHGFTCQGLSVYKLMSVAGGIGLVINEIRVPGVEATLRAEFLSRVASVTWMPLTVVEVISRR